MSLLWLGKNGWTQIGPASPTQADGLNLDRLLAGLAGTNALEGTQANSLTATVGLYLNARGIPSTAFTYTTTNQPTLAQIAAQNQAQAVETMLIGWYAPNPDGSYTRLGGHFLTVLAQPASGADVVVNDPAPSSLQAVPDQAAYARQSLATSPFTGTSPDLPAPPPPGTSYLRFPAVTWSGATAAVTPVIESIYSLTVQPSQQPSQGWTPATWSPGVDQVINANEATFTVLAPLTGSGGLIKQGAGTLVLQGPNTTTGTYAVAGGTIRAVQAGGTPLGTGSLVLNGGTVALGPAASGGDGGATLGLAAGQGSRVTFTAGDQLVLDRGQNSGLVVNLGGPTSSNAPGLLRQANGTLTVSVPDGAAALGSTVQLNVAGGVGSLMPSGAAIVDPSVVARSPASRDAGDFLTYGTSGFARPAYTSSGAVPIDKVAAGAIYQVDNDQTLAAGATATVAALKVGPHRIGAGGDGTVLQLAPAAGQDAGLILNGGSIAAGQLAFGVADAVVYTGGAGGTIASTITGSGSLTTFGPGTLSLAGANAYTGGTLVEAGTLRVANTAGSATGTGPLTVQGTGTLLVDGPSGSVAGLVNALAGGTVRLAGGTLAGGLNVGPASSLAGSGTIGGTAVVDGQILAGATPGLLTFTGATTFGSAITFDWRLVALVDDATAGLTPAWNSILFGAPTAPLTIGTAGNPVNVLLDLSALGDSLGPNSGNAFRDSAHAWTLFRAPARFNELYYSIS